MATFTKFTLSGFLLLLTLGLGLWVSLSGKPYHGLLFNAHKLAALAAVILIVVRMLMVFKGIHLQPLVVILLALAVLCVIALFVTRSIKYWHILIPRHSDHSPGDSHSFTAVNSLYPLSFESKRPSMKYNSILVTQHGEPETIQIIENELRTPAPGEVCIRILASPVCQDDVAVRVGNRPFLPKLPFIPGYSIVGEVTAIGEGVSKVAVKDHAAALTNFGGHAEYIYSKAEQLMPVPANLDPAEAVVLILNYLVAYQVLHRVARVKTGDKVLLIGASGGVGTAFLQLGKLAGLKMYGLASPSKHKILSEYRTIPIDYHTQDFVKVIKQAEPEGLDYVFNGMGEEYLGRGRSVLRRGGMLVHYGAPQSLLKFGSFLARFVFYSFFSNGKKMEGYGTHRLGVELFKEDWTVLFKLLEEGQIKPIISAKFPILEAAQGYRLLESGQVAGNIVLLSPDLM